MYLKHPGDGDAEDENDDDDEEKKEYRPYDDEMSGPLNFHEYIAEQKRRNIAKAEQKLNWIKNLIKKVFTLELFSEYISKFGLASMFFIWWRLS